MQRGCSAAMQALGALDGPDDHPEGPIAASRASAADVGSCAELDAPDLVVGFMQTLLVSPNLAPHPFDGSVDVFGGEAVPGHSKQ